jgi:hypothetical protein
MSSTTKAATTTSGRSSGRNTPTFLATVNSNGRTTPAMLFFDTSDNLVELAANNNFTSLWMPPIN